MNKQIIIFIVIFVLFAVSCKQDIKIACVGNSITEGTGIDYQSKSSYPVILDSILGENYTVLNCGRSGATMLKKSDLPFWKCNEFYNVFAFKPDIVIIILGTNDSKKFNWNASQYENDFQAMIDTLKTISTKPKLFVCLPPPVFKMAWSIDDSTITAGVIPIIKKLQKSNDFQLIDLNTKMRSQPGNFPDGVHPNENGAKLMAEIIAGEIKK